jgi:hypothetical protein
VFIALIGAEILSSAYFVILCLIEDTYLIGSTIGVKETFTPSTATHRHTKPYSSQTQTIKYVEMR